MKILHLGNETWDSGLTEYSLVLAAAQQSAGREVLYLARAGSHASRRAYKLGIKGAAFRGWRDFYKLVRMARHFAPEVINAHTGGSHTMAVALNAFLKSPAAIVRTRADARPAQRRLFSGPLWKRTNGFMAANSLILADFKRLGLSGVCADMVGQGIFDGAPAAKPPKKDNIFRVAIVARLDPVKGHRTAIEAFARLLKTCPQARLEVSGEDCNISAAQLRQFTDRLGISSSVEFRGRVPDVFEYMSGFDAGIVPSLGSEAVSRAALEWQCCGVPVVASAVGGLPDMVRDGVNGFLVPPGDTALLAAALSKLAAEPELAAQMGRSARENYLSGHTPQAFEQAAYDLYEWAICGVSRRQRKGA
ncbi:MAG: glycosyltransferase family 4 protein [Elusimicrobiales bacterium]